MDTTMCSRCGGYLVPPRIWHGTLPPPMCQCASIPCCGHGCYHHHCCGHLPHAPWIVHSTSANPTYWYQQPYMGAGNAGESSQ